MFRVPRWTQIVMIYTVWNSLYFAVVPRALVEQVENLEAQEPQGQVEQVENLEAQEPQGQVGQVENLEAQEPQGQVAAAEPLEALARLEHLGLAVAAEPRVQVVVAERLVHQEPAERLAHQELVAPLVILVVGIGLTCHVMIVTRHMNGFFMT